MAQSQLFTPHAASKRTPTTDRLQVQLSENERFSTSSDEEKSEYPSPIQGNKENHTPFRGNKIRQVRAMSYGHKRANTNLTQIVSGETKELTKELTITEMKVENVNTRLLTPSQVQIQAMRLRLRASSHVQIQTCLIHQKF